MKTVCFSMRRSSLEGAAMISPRGVNAARSLSLAPVQSANRPMTHARPLAAAVALALAALAPPAFADGPADPGKEAASYRESVYHVIKWNWMRMGAMVKGEKA